MITIAPLWCVWIQCAAAAVCRWKELVREGSASNCEALVKHCCSRVCLCNGANGIAQKYNMTLFAADVWRCRVVSCCTLEKYCRVFARHGFAVSEQLSEAVFV